MKDRMRIFAVAAVLALSLGMVAPAQAPGQSGRDHGARPAAGWWQAAVDTLATLFGLDKPVSSRTEPKPGRRLVRDRPLGQAPACLGTPAGVPGRQLVRDRSRRASRSATLARRRSHVCHRRPRARGSCTRGRSRRSASTLPLDEGLPRCYEADFSHRTSSARELPRVPSRPPPGWRRARPAGRYHEPALVEHLVEQCFEHRYGDPDKVLGLWRGGCGRGACQLPPSPAAADATLPRLPSPLQLAPSPRRVRARRRRLRSDGQGRLGPPARRSRPSGQRCSGSMAACCTISAS